jgi:hypothetical protein
LRAAGAGTFLGFGALFALMAKEWFLYAQLTRSGFEALDALGENQAIGGDKDTANYSDEVTVSV